MRGSGLGRVAAVAGVVAAGVGSPGTAAAAPLMVGDVFLGLFDFDSPATGQIHQYRVTGSTASRIDSFATSDAPTPGGGTGTLRASYDGPNGSPTYYQIAR